MGIEKNHRLTSVLGGDRLGFVYSFQEGNGWLIQGYFKYSMFYSVLFEDSDIGS